MELKKIMKDLNFSPKSDKHLLKVVASLCKTALTVLHHHLTLKFLQGSHHADQLHLLYLWHLNRYWLLLHRCSHTKHRQWHLQVKQPHFQNSTLCILLLLHHPSPWPYLVPVCEKNWKMPQEDQLPYHCYQVEVAKERCKNNLFLQENTYLYLCWRLFV